MPLRSRIKGSNKIKRLLSGIQADEGRVKRTYSQSSSRETYSRVHGTHADFFLQE